VNPESHRPSPYWADRHLWQITPIKEALLAASAMFVVWLSYRTSHVLMPVLVGWLLAYVCHPLLTWAKQRLSVPRPVTSGIILTIAMAVWVALGIWLAPILIEQATALVERAPAYLERFGAKYDIDTSDFSGRVREWVISRREQPTAILDALGGVMVATTDVLLWLFLPPICFFFFAWWMPNMYRSTLRYVPASKRERARHLLEKMNSEVGSFLRARLIVSVIIGVLFSAGFYLAEVPYWFVLGMGTGLLSMIPYISVVGWIVAVAVKYFDMTIGDGEATWTAVLLWPSVVYWGVNLFEEWVLMPWIQSRQMNLSALTTLIVVLIGGVLAGLMGMLLAVPVTACLKIIAVEEVLPRLRAWAQTQ
jgi:predicted PurR-regulated permease PerM